MAERQATLKLTREEHDTPSLRLYMEEAQAIDDLFRQAATAHGTTAFGDFLDFVIRHRRYSVFNAMLIHVQCPGATLIYNRENWKQSENRTAIPTRAGQAATDAMGELFTERYYLIEHEATVSAASDGGLRHDA